MHLLGRILIDDASPISLSKIKNMYDKLKLIKKTIVNVKIIFYLWILNKIVTIKPNINKSNILSSVKSM
jgi:hypothetical protein